MADYETQIRSQMNQLLTWEQYRDLLLNTLSAADYPGLEDQVRSEFSEQYIDNPKLMADWLVELFSPHELISNELRSMAALSGPTFLLDSLLVVNRTRNLLSNGRFPEDISGWQDLSSAGGSIEWDSAGRLQLDSVSGTARATIDTVVVPGKRFVVRGQAFASNPEEVVAYAGSTSNGLDLFGGGVGRNLEGGELLSEVVTSTTSLISLSYRLFQVASCDVDDVQLRQLEA